MSKCGRGGLHQPPRSLGMLQLGGQKLVAVMVTEVPRRHHCGSARASQVSLKHRPQEAPSLKSAVLSAAFRVP